MELVADAQISSRSAWLSVSEFLTVSTLDTAVTIRSPQLPFALQPCRLDQAYDSPASLGLTAARAPSEARRRVKKSQVSCSQAARQPGQEPAGRPKGLFSMGPSLLSGCRCPLRRSPPLPSKRAACESLVEGTPRERQPCCVGTRHGHRTTGHGVEMNTGVTELLFFSALCGPMTCLRKPLLV